MAKYSQGICGGGAAILEDSRMMTVDEVVARLNELDGKVREVKTLERFAKTLLSKYKECSGLPLVQPTNCLKGLLNENV